MNSDHALVKKVLEDAEANTAESLKPILAEIKGQEARLAVLHQEQGKKKPEEITQEEKDDVHNTEKAISDEKAKRNDIISGYAKNNNIVHQLIDLALLQWYAERRFSRCLPEEKCGYDQVIAAL